MGTINKLEATPLDPADLLTPQELADRLKLPLSWVYEKCRSNGKHGNPLPVLRCGRYLRFSWTEVVKWMRSNSHLTNDM
jgi:hypothetical protein